MVRELRDPSGRDPGMEFALFVAAIVVVVGTGLWLALLIGADPAAPGNPFAAIAALITGEITWTTLSTMVAVGYGVLLLAVAGAILTRKIRSARSRSRIDDRAEHMGTLRDVTSLTEKSVRAAASRLQVDMPDRRVPGVPLGRHLPSKKMLYSSYEDLHVWICGPRVGKSTAIVNPAVVSAPGAVLTTSNKRDVVDATRGVRDNYGTAWVFDPQQVATEPASWWWNPLSWLRREIDGEQIADEVRAADLAEHFASGSAAADAKTDSFFDPSAKNLLTGLFLAATLADRPITDVYTWATDETSQEPVRILEHAGPRYRLQAEGLAGQYNAPDKQRGGVFGTARKMIHCLTIQSIRPWVTGKSTGHRARPHFDPAAFVRSTDTLYPLSREGAGSAGPLVTALTVAVCEAAEQYATVSPGGRMPIPLLAPLDEAANVVRWSNLPKLYSHYGSRGVVIQTILQSYEQGVSVWGRDGMAMLTSAANVLAYGGGVKVGGDGFLRSMSEAIGDHYEMTGSVSTSGNGTGNRSISRQRSRVRTFTEKDLEALPRGRAIIRSSGNPAVLIATVPFWEGPYADAIADSTRTYAPSTGNGTPAEANDPVPVSAGPPTGTLVLDGAVVDRKELS